MDFKKGDTVKCVIVDGYDRIIKDSIYTVEFKYLSGNLLLEGIADYTFAPSFFELYDGSPQPCAVPGAPAVDILMKKAGLKHIEIDTDVVCPGGSTHYYELPPGAKELQDLIEFKDMNFAVGNIFKAAYRLNDKLTDPTYDLNKIIWFAKRMLNEINTKSTDGAG